MSEDPFSQTIASALDHHRAGRYAQSEALYRQILTQQPRHARALHLLGLLAHQTAHHPAALALIEQSLLVEPDRPEVLNSQGMVLAALGRADDAVKAYRKALALRPGYAPSLNNLGIVLQGQGKLEEAKDCFMQAVCAQQGFVAAMSNLAGSLIALKEVDRAMAICESALRQHPDATQILYQLGRAREMTGKPELAGKAYEQLVKLAPRYLDAHLRLATVQTSLGQFESAVRSYQNALAIDNQHAIAHANLGSLYHDLGQNELAIAELEKAVALDPQSAESHCNLGLALASAGRIDDGARHQRRATQLQPSLVQSWANLAGAMRELGEIDQAIEAGRSAVAHRAPTAMHSNLLYATHFHPAYSPRDIYNEHIAWADRHASGLECFLLNDHDRNSNRPIRVGLMSPDFRQHVVGWNLLPFLRNYDRTQFALTCYSDVRSPDIVTQRIKSLTSGWRETARLSDEQIAAQVQADRIDILVDLTLHMACNRLLVFARKPAPVQLTYLGYCSTTGLASVDYRFSDHHLDPAEMDLTCYAEKTWRLPTSYWCYEAPETDIPQRDSTPGRMFGCLNSYAKVSLASLDLWARVLHAAPNSRLLLHASEGSARRRAADRLSSHGIDGERIEFVGKQPWANYLATYQRIDVSLDPLPYGGGITSCDSLYMGTPLVSLSGQTAVGRSGRTVLHNTGLPQLCAATADQYVDVARRLMEDTDQRNAWRQTLRQQMRNSPIMDQQRFCADIENALRSMWSAFVSNGG